MVSSISLTHMNAPEVSLEPFFSSVFAELALNN